MERWCQVHYVMKYRLVIYGPTINHPEQYACVYVFFSIILFDFCQIEQIFFLSILSCFNKNQVWLITRRSPEVGNLYVQFFLLDFTDGGPSEIYYGLFAGWIGMEICFAQQYVYWFLLVLTSVGWKNIFFIWNLCLGIFFLFCAVRTGKWDFFGMH